MGVKTVIPLTDQPSHPLGNGLPRLFHKPLHHYSLHVFNCLESVVLQQYPDGGQTHEVTLWTIQAVNSFQCMKCSTFWTMQVIDRWTWSYNMKTWTHSTENGKTVSVDDTTKVLEGYTVWLWFGQLKTLTNKELKNSLLVPPGWIMTLECQHLTMSHRSHLLLKHIFCHIVLCQLLVCQAQTYYHLWQAIFARNTQTGFIQPQYWRFKSSWTAWTWRGRQYNPLKCELFTHKHSITYHSTSICNTTVTTSNLTRPPR